MKSYLQNHDERESGQKLVEGVLPHGGGGEDGDEGDQVGDEAEHAEAGEKYALTPKLEILPGLRQNV